MQLPDKLYKRLPGDPKLYDDAGNTIEQRVYYNRFSDKSYILIWEDKPDCTDGPVWYYERNNPIASMPGFMNMLLKTAQEGLNKTNNIQSRTGDKFCRNCGTVLKGTEKFCRECGSSIISVK